MRRHQPPSHEDELDSGLHALEVLSSTVRLLLQAVRSRLQDVGRLFDSDSRGWPLTAPERVLKPLAHLTDNKRIDVDDCLRY